jgi:hypothetical protein
MTAYTANLTITATTAWDTWYRYSERACNDTAKVYRWYVATFFSAKAQARYEWIGNMIGTLAALAILYILYTQRWAEAEVQSCIQANDHVPDAGEMVADPFAPEANPAYASVAATLAAPVATLVVPVANEYHGLTTVQLRKECQAQGIKWRNAHGTRHLSKGEMIEALS